MNENRKCCYDDEDYLALSYDMNKNNYQSKMSEKVMKEGKVFDKDNC